MYVYIIYNLNDLFSTNTHTHTHVNFYLMGISSKIPCFCHVFGNSFQTISIEINNQNKSYFSFNKIVFHYTPKPFPALDFAWGCQNPINYLNFEYEDVW